jgi:hypothetical protein
MENRKYRKEQKDILERVCKRQSLLNKAVDALYAGDIELVIDCFEKLKGGE